MREEVPMMILVALLLWSVATVQQPPPPSATSDLGVIKGTVLDSEGKPVEGAFVYAAAEDMPMMGRPRTVTTNAKGEFVLDQVIPAKVVELHAYKESEYYPDVINTFNDVPGPWEMPKVEVKPDKSLPY
jgi:Carboxypeptidase regulatory-like domain